MNDSVTGRWFLKSAVDSGFLVKTVTGEWQWKTACFPTKTGEWVHSSQVSSYESHKPYRYMGDYAVPRDEVVTCVMTREMIYKPEAVQLTPVAWVKASNFEAFVRIQPKAVIARYLPEIQPRCMEVREAVNKSAETGTPAASAVGRPLRPAAVPFAVRGHQVSALQALALEDAVLSGQITTSSN